MKRLAILAACATLQACGTNYHVEYEHVSHLSAGFPFGPESEEATLDHISLCGERSFRWMQTEACVGYNLRPEGDFYGPRDTAVFRIKVPLRLNR